MRTLALWGATLLLAFLFGCRSHPTKNSKTTISRNDSGQVEIPDHALWHQKLKSLFSELKADDELTLIMSEQDEEFYATKKLSMSHNTVTEAISIDWYDDSGTDFHIYIDSARTRCVFLPKDTVKAKPMTKEQIMMVLKKVL